MTDQPSKPAREAGGLSLGFSRRSRPLRRLINRLATHHGQQHFCLAGLVARNFEKILRDNDKVSQFAGLKRTFELVAPARISRAQCVRSYRVLQADALLRVSIECGTDSFVSDGVSENLQPPPIEFGDGLSIFFRVPEELSRLAGIIAVRLKHRRSVCFDDAVEHGFHDSAGDPVIFVFLPRLLDLLDGVWSQLRRIEEIRYIETQRKLVVLRELII